MRISNRKNQRGVILLLACFCMPVMIGMLGLGVDLSAMYSVKARLQMACDGAAIAAIRSMSLAQDLSSQQTAAQAVALQWFAANFNGNFLGTSSAAPTVGLTVDPGGSRSITVTASTRVPTFFMRYLGRTDTPITASGTTSRRDIVMMLVLDRSGSMNNSNNTYGGLLPCDVMKASAKQFLGMFTPGRDKIGMVTFGETGLIAASPTNSFQSTLGYTNAMGSSVGAIDNISCGGWTNTSTGLALAYNELFKTGLRGAQNIIVLFTDGQPTASTFDFRGVMKPSSGCLDNNAAAPRGGNPINSLGNMTQYPRNWLASQSSAGNVVDLGSGSYAGFNSPIAGPVGSLATDGGSLSGIDKFFTPGASPVEGWLTRSDAPGCNMPDDAPDSQPPHASGVPTDIIGIPTTDVWGNASAGYKGNLTTTSGIIDLNGANLATINFNTADNMGNAIRNFGVQINAIGLGGNGGVNHELLQRLANDQLGDATAIPPYGPNSAFNPSQPKGTYKFSPSAAQIPQSFSDLGSVLMRMSR